MISANRVAVISDVHGNAVALEAVLGELEAVEHDLVVVGGDLTWGSLPEETLSLAEGIERLVIFVRGNAERALAEAGEKIVAGDAEARRGRSRRSLRTRLGGQPRRLAGRLPRHR